MNPCPQEVIEMGAALVNARRKAAVMTIAIREAVEKLPAAYAALPTGLRRMQLGEGLSHLNRAVDAEAQIMMAHNSLRLLLAEVGVAEPTDAQITDILGGRITPQGGGGGGR